MLSFRNINMALCVSNGLEWRKTREIATSFRVIAIVVRHYMALHNLKAMRYKK